MKDYSSAKIELLALKWSVCEKFKDYLLGSKFTVYTDNNLLVYVKSSKLGAAQIRWLSELALYDFDIIYRMGKSNLVADALSRWPEPPSDRNNKGGSDSDEDWEAISYPVTHISHIPEDPIIITSQVISDELNTVVGGVKIHNDLRERIEMVGTAYEEIGEIDPINIQIHITEVFSQITPEQMAEYQRMDNQIGPILPWVQEGKVPPKSVLYKVKSKTCRKIIFSNGPVCVKTRGFTSVIYSRGHGVSSISPPSKITQQSFRIGSR